MKKVLFLHGWGGNGKENWFSWLKKELENKGFKVYNPEMPNTEIPNYNEQINFIIDYYEKNGKFDYFIGHSLGCLTTLHLLEQKNICGVKSIFVGPAYKGIVEELGKKAFGEAVFNLEEYFNKNLKFKKLDNKYKIFLSKDDPYINFESAKKYFKNLENTEFIDFQNMGHFNKSAGVFKLKEILNYINF